MNFKDINNSFKEQWNVLPIDYDDSDKGTLDKLLSEVIDSLGNSTDWDRYSKSFEECIEKVFPEESWWENVGLDIRTDLFNTQDPKVTKQHILDSIIEPTAYTKPTNMKESFEHPGEINYKDYIIKFQKDGRANILDKDFNVVRTDIGSEEEGREYIDAITEAFSDKLAQAGTNIGKNLSRFGGWVGGKLDKAVEKTSNAAGNVLAKALDKTSDETKAKIGQAMSNNKSSSNNKASTAQTKTKVTPQKINKRFTLSTNNKDPYWEITFNNKGQKQTVYARGANKQAAVQDAKALGIVPANITGSIVKELKNISASKDAKLDKLHTVTGNAHKFTQDQVSQIINSSLDTSKKLDEDLEVKEEVDFNDLLNNKCWGQAVQNLKEIEDAGLEDELMDYLEEISKGEPMDMTDLNDILAYDWESVFETIGMPSDDDIEESVIKEVDDDVADELALCINTDGNIYRMFITPVINNLKKKLSRGIFDRELAKKAFFNVVNNSLSYPMFSKDSGFTKRNVNIPTRWQVAEYLLDDYMDEIEYEDNLQEGTVKKSNGKWTNRGDDGKEHGEFNTKKEADAQRKAMYANGFKESWQQEANIPGIGWSAPTFYDYTNEIVSAKEYLKDHPEDRIATKELEIIEGKLKEDYKKLDEFNHYWTKRYVAMTKFINEQNEQLSKVSEEFR